MQPDGSAQAKLTRLGRRQLDDALGEGGVHVQRLALGHRVRAHDRVRELDRRPADREAARCGAIGLRLSSQLPPSVEGFVCAGLQIKERTLLV